MNQPAQPPNLTPLVQWLEANKLVRPGTTAAMHALADKVKELGAALRAAGVKGA